MNFKTCSKCRVAKRLGEFNKDSHLNGGLCSQCKSCLAAYYENNKDKILVKKATYYNANKEVIAAQTASYYEANKEVIAAQKATYYNANKEVIAVKRATHYENNKDKILVKMAAYSKAYSKANPHLINAKNAKRRFTKRHQTPAWVGPGELKMIQDLYKLAKSLTLSTGIQHHVDHIYPLVSDRGAGFHCLANLQILTATENLAKSNKWPEY